MAGVVVAAVLSIVFVSQQQVAIGKPAVHRIGFLGFRPLPEFELAVSRLRAGLQDLGHVEGKDYVLLVRLDDDNPHRNPAVIRELTGAKVKLIVAASVPAAVAIHQTNPLMPVVIAQGDDIVASKLANSVERPGGFATGLEELKPGMTDKRLRLLKQAQPAISRIAILSPTATESGHALQYREAEQTAAAIGLKLRSYRVSAASDFDEVLDAVVRDGAQGLLVFNGSLPLPIQLRIVHFAAEHRLPAMYASDQFVTAGGLMSYGADEPERFRLAAALVDRILKGAKPADLPLTYDPELRLIVNQDAAERIGLTLPKSFVAAMVSK